MHGGEGRREGDAIGREIRLPKRDPVGKTSVGRTEVGGWEAGRRETGRR